MSLATDTPEPEHPLQSRRLKVFISYARRDGSALAQDIVAGLELAGFDAFVDREDIAAAEDWEGRLGKLIQSADTVVFLLSPGAVASERCGWEVRRARDLEKRLIPIIAAPVQEREVPGELRRLNFIDFSDEKLLLSALRRLAAALRDNLEWIREHTRLAEAASRWHEHARPDALLLRGEELAVAQAWKAARHRDAPEITDLQSELVAASAEAETARASLERQRLAEIQAAQTERSNALAEREGAVKRLKRFSIAFGIASVTVAGVVGVLGYWAYRSAVQLDAARAQAVDAEARSFEATIEREAARTDIEGQLTAYAASPRQMASDGAPGENSPYTKILLAELEDRNASLQVALARSNRKVLQDTNQVQRPYLASDLNGDIFLQRPPASRKCRAISISADTAGASFFPNVERDAVRWEEQLTRWGFVVRRLVNPTRQAVLDSVLQARVTDVTGAPPHGAPGNTCVLFFFSGGGLQVDGEEFILLRDTRLDSTPLIRRTAIRVDEVSRLLRETAAASFLVLDTAFPDWNE